MKTIQSAILLLAIAILISPVFCQQTERDHGIDLYREGKFVEAISQLEKAIVSTPKDRLAWLYLGAAYVHSDNEKAARKAFSKAKGIREGDLPKYDKPVKFISKPHAQFPNGAVHGSRVAPPSSSQTPGKATVVVELLANGQLGFIRVIETSDSLFGQNSTLAAQGIKFEPAVKDGKPVTSVTILEYTFWIQ
jgi:tetratricopeptide (TPR) repeat protein